MDSARQYQSARTLRISYEEIGVSAQGGNGLTSFDNILSEDSDAKEPSGEEATSDKDTFSDPFEMLSRKNTSSINKQMQSASCQFQRLHQLMIRHIFRLLFGGGYDKAVSNTDMTEEQNLPSVTSFSSLNNYQVVTKVFTSSGYFEESESTSFNCAGQVKTSDGRSIDINMNVSMSRNFASYYEANFASEKLQLCDPLVINFDSPVAGLDSEYSFFFDLDTDGEEEKIARLTSGSGYLAIDLNEDGVINDGSELFGPKSGNGFADLSSYDEDHNGWIDENDSVFEKLKIWSKDENGNDVLYTLKEKNVGALYTGAADTQFALNDASNNSLGYIRQTGVFLYEDGKVGTLQHVDLVS